MSHFEGKDSIQNPDLIFPAIEEMRTPIQYLANMLTAGDTEVVKEALQRMAMMRSYKRAEFSKQPLDESRLARVGLNARQIEEMYRLLAIAKYEDRFVIPTSHKEGYMDPFRAQGMEGFGGMNCDGCGPASPRTESKSGKGLYEENFYGGIWRD
ncbi:Respiratory nitrate reductase 2 beta chain [compost metagenome]